MANLAVKYDNDLNLVAFKNFSKIENDVFFALIWKLRDQGNKEIRLDFAELRSLIDLRNMTNKEISEAITNIGDKISRSVIRYETETEIQFFTVFQVLAVPKNTDDFYIRAKINEPFLYILNDFKAGNFTIWELIEFGNLSSKYTQTLYRLLKQFRGKGALFLEWNKFIDLLDIPKSYKMSDIDKRVLKPAIKELSEKTLFSNDRVIFNNLRYEKIRGRGRGRPIKNINFYFDPEDTDNKTIKKRKVENEKTEFSNQFYGKKISTNGTTFLIYKIYKNSDGTITADLENFSRLNYGRTEPYNFENLEILKKLIVEYEKDNPKKDRPEVRKFFK